MMEWLLILSLLLVTFARSRQVALRDEYLKYLEKHEKPLGRADDAVRLETFKKAKDFVVQHAAGSHSYHVGLNQMADMLPHELPRTETATVQSASSATHRHSSEYVLKTGQLKRTRKVTNVERYLSWQEKSLSVGGEQVASLNWGSENNPYNVSIVGAIGNQGVCGACWSFVAAAATEALVYMSSGIHLRLSEQELIDCDRSFNRGCEGGNPVYAFDYIIKWGLTNQGSYPYREKEHSQCRRSQYVSKAAIRGYLRLPSDNQALIKRFLRIGPVATGICGTDPSFLYYTGGLFNPQDCCVTQNHAVLIVGFGRDEEAGIDFFIIKNSWGRFWGEEGYMRLAITESSDSDGNGEGYSHNDRYDRSAYIDGTRAERRGLDAYGRHGLCGVALGPSVPTDGILLPGYGGSALRHEPASHGKNSSKMDVLIDDDSYADDAAATWNPNGKDLYPGQDSLGWGSSLRHLFRMLSLWWQVNRTNTLFIFALVMFVCSCGLCMCTVYDDCVNPVYDEGLCQSSV